MLVVETGGGGVRGIDEVGIYIVVVILVDVVGGGGGGLV